MSYIDTGNHEARHMIIQLVESLVYACANAAIRTPARRRQRQAPRRVLSGAAADLLIQQLRIERERVETLRQAHTQLALENAELGRELAAAQRIFARRAAQPSA